MAEPIWEKDEHTVAPTGNILTTFAVLGTLAMIQLGIGFSGLGGSTKLLLAMSVSVTQASVLAVWFMDLRQADKLTWLIAASGIFWVGLMFLFTVTDFVTRHIAVY
ncbi:MAG: hypothetical protein ACRC7O_01315 [Fimbriiglobus sp.]